MAAAVYILCALTSIACAALLFAQYRRTPRNLLFWGASCFVCLALTNVLLFVDLTLLASSADLSGVRSALTLTGLLMMLYGLIRETT